jgi:tRNA-guanine family transglycosylase
MKFFEIYRDSGSPARLGTLNIKGKEIKTPILWIGHDFEHPVPLWEYSANQIPGLLVNACGILRSPKRFQLVSLKGIHHYTGYTGAIMMDSGGFLFQRHQSVDICTDKISDLYEKANVDIGVILDHPLDPTLTSSSNNRRWRRTLYNTSQMINYSKSRILMPVVHGYSLRALRLACQQIKEVIPNPFFIGIGSLVPLIKRSHIKTLFCNKKQKDRKKVLLTFIADAVKLVRSEFPASVLHVFGAGSIGTALSFFYLGADSVDSVAWRIKASFGAIQMPGFSDRFLSPRHHTQKTRKVITDEELEILSTCNCPICSKYKSVSGKVNCLDSSFVARAVHNGTVFVKEVEEFRNAIQAGKSKEYLGARISAQHIFHFLFQ